MSQRDQGRQGAGFLHGELQPFHLARVFPEVLGQPHPHIHRVPVLILIGGDRLPADQGPHGPHDIRGHHPRVHGLFPVHGQAKLGNVLLQGDLQVHDSGDLVDLFLQLSGILLQEGDVLAPDVDHQGFLTAPSRPFQDGRQDAGDLLDPGSEVPLDLFLIALPLFSFLEFYEHLGIAHRSRVSGPDGGVGMFHLGDLFQGRLDRGQTAPGLFHGGIRCALEIQLEFPLVEIGEKLRLQNEKHAQSPEEGRRGQEEDGLAVIEGPADHRPVSIRRPVEPVIEVVEDPGDESAVSLAAQYPGPPSGRRAWGPG